MENVFYALQNIENSDSAAVSKQKYACGCFLLTKEKGK